MANELTISASLNYSKSGVVDGMAKGGLQRTVTGTRYVKNVQLIGTSEEAINIAELGSLGYAMFENLDATNYIEIRVATSGAKAIKLLPGDVACFRFGSGAQVPYAISDTAACYMRYEIHET